MVALASTARFTIVGNYLYTVDKQNLKVFSLFNLAKPVLKRNQDWFFDGIPYGNTLIAWAEDEAILFDITNKGNPIFIAKII